LIWINMALSHACSGQAVDIRPYGDHLADHMTFALFKSEQLEVMRVVLMAGKSLPPHQVSGEITIQCIEGMLRVDAGGESAVLDAGHMLFLEGGVGHGVVALEDSSALVTLVLKAPFF
jgi:quercetin dioxygenase-like cupin family protein